MKSTTPPSLRAIANAISMRLRTATGVGEGSVAIAQANVELYASARSSASRRPWKRGFENRARRSNCLARRDQIQNRNNPGQCRSVRRSRDADQLDVRNRRVSQDADPVGPRNSCDHYAQPFDIPGRANHLKITQEMHASKQRGAKSVCLYFRVYLLRERPRRVVATHLASQFR